MFASANPPLSLQSVQTKYLEDIIKIRISAIQTGVGIKTPADPSSPTLFETPSPTSFTSSIRPSTKILSASAIVFLNQYGVSCIPSAAGSISVPVGFLGVGPVEQKDSFWSFVDMLPETFESVACLRYLGLKKRVAAVILDQFDHNASNEPVTLLHLALEYIKGFPLPLMWSELSRDEKLVTMKNMGLNKVMRRTISCDAPDLARATMKEVASKTFRALWTQLCGVEERIHIYREEITQLLETVLPSVEFPGEEPEVVDSSSDDGAQLAFNNDTLREATDATEETVEEAAPEPKDDPMDIEIAEETAPGYVPLVGLPTLPCAVVEPR